MSNTDCDFESVWGEGHERDVVLKGLPRQRLEKEFGGDVEAAAKAPNVVLVEIAPRRSVRGAKIALRTRQE